MKVTRVYEVWVGGDLVDDQLNLDQALNLARKEFALELKNYPDEKPDVVIDEHSYIHIESDEDLDTVDFLPKWRETDTNDTER